MSSDNSLALDTSNLLTGWPLHAVIACLFFAQFLIALDTTMINVALPNITSQFHALEEFAWYGTAYLLPITAFQLIYGSMYTLFQVDVVYRISLLIFEVGSALCTSSTSSNMFIIGRAVAGLGAAGVLQGSLSLISQVVALEKRPLHMGIMISVFPISSTVGPLLGLALTQNLTWRWCFWINLPIGLVVIVALTFVLGARKSKNSSTKERELTLTAKIKSMDWLGALLFLGATTCLLLALQWGGQTKSWHSPDVVGCFVGAGIIFTLFIAWQLQRQDRALIPPRIWRKRSIWAGSGVLFFLGAQTYIDGFYLPFWFQAVKGLDPVATGVDFTAFTVPQIVALIAVGALVKQYGHYVSYMVVDEMICLVGQVKLAQLETSSSTLYWAAFLPLAAFGSGMAMQLPYTALALVLSDKDIPVGNAVAVLSYQLGGAIAISLRETITLFTLLDLVPKRLPGIPPQAVVAMGAANLSALASSPENLAALQDIWNTAITRSLNIGIAALVIAFCFTSCMEWLNALKVAEERKNPIKEKEQETGDSGKEV
ncbi:Major facilitator superfamily domain containing protein [Rhypophila decipiens]